MDFPVMDISDSPAGLAAATHAACRDIGFFGVVGHGVTDDVVEGAWQAASEFFDLPMDQKLSWQIPGSFYGYSPFATEALARSRGGESAPDLKESYNLGPIHLPDSGVVWPDAPLGFRQTWTAYYLAMEGLANRLLGIFAAALDLPAHEFTQHFGRHTSALRALNYPAFDRPVAPGQVRAGAHSDYGSLTILLPGPGRGGLEVLTRNGDWMAVPPVDGGFVVNIGDLMQRWTNDRWMSTVHRVVNPPAEVAATERRQSIAFFQNPDIDALIEVLPSGGDRHYEPVVFGDWLRHKAEAVGG